VLPNLVTLAAVLDAVPLEDGDALQPPGATLVLDTTLQSVFGTNGSLGYGALKASRYVYENHINATGGAQAVVAHPSPPLPSPVCSFPARLDRDFPMQRLWSCHDC
jgi:hypothetical protein